MTNLPRLDNFKHATSLQMSFSLTALHLYACLATLLNEITSEVGKMGKFLAISEKELEMLEAWEKHRNIKLAAQALGLKPSTAYNRMARLRWRYHLAKQFIRDVERWFAKLPSALEI